VSPPQDTSNDPAKRPASRPSLGTGSSTAAAGREGATASSGSILQALDAPDALLSDGPGAAPRAWGVWALAAGVVLAVAAAGWVALRPKADLGPSIEIAAAKPSRPAVAPVVVPPAMPSGAASAAASAASDTAASTPVAVAQLELLPDAAASAPAGAGTALAAATATAAVAAAAAQPAPKTNLQTNTKPAKKPVEKTRTAAAGPSRTASAKPIKPAAPSAATTTTATATAKATLRADDPDIELMTALMSHVGASRAGATGAPLPRNQQATIANLVASCRSKTGTEADECRRSICDGYWGKAEACPARSKPAAKTKPPPVPARTADASRKASPLQPLSSKP
jgi:hypothetical protein